MFSLSRNITKRLCGLQGSILVEVLLSLVIFLVGLTGSFALLNHSANINSLNKNRIIANNLAREGLEVIKNMRDSNWLVYSANMRACWHFSPDMNEDGSINLTETCVPDASGQNIHPFGVDKSGNRIRSVIADFDPASLRWLLVPATYFLSTDETQFEPYTSAIPNGETNPEGMHPQLYVTSTGRYTHQSLGNTITPFYRIVDIYYVDNSAEDFLFPVGSTLPAGEGAWKDNRIKIVAKVYWKDLPTSSTFQELKLETILTDYLERDNWND